jgi:hypothetical protein
VRRLVEDARRILPAIGVLQAVGKVFFRLDDRAARRMRHVGVLVVIVREPRRRRERARALATLVFGVQTPVAERVLASGRSKPLPILDWDERFGPAAALPR